LSQHGERHHLLAQGQWCARTTLALVADHDGHTRVGPEVSAGYAMVTEFDAHDVLALRPWGAEKAGEGLAENDQGSGQVA